MSFETHHAQALCYLTSSRLASIPHAFSTRQGGVSHPPFDALNLGVSRGDDPVYVAENYRRFCAAVGTDVQRVVLSQQTHTDHIRRVTAEDAGKGLWRERDYRDIDALITDVPGLALTVFSADCGIILLYDPVHQAIGAVHAGWRGCAAGILQKTVEAMTAAYGTDPTHLLAAIGPCIGRCCFETDSDVPEAMRRALGDDAEACIEFRGPKWHVDLAGLNRQWLLRAGIPATQIDLCSLCTACHPELFWSHRKMGNARGAQVAMIALPDGRERQ